MVLGDSVTTDHISPAGSIALNSPAARYLMEHGVEPRDFNSYGSRRGNDRVMVRGTFANIRIKNLLLPGSEGGVTLHLPSGEMMSVFDAAERYKAEGTPLIVIAGKEYGTGSSRDWAAKGPLLLGVRAVIAESFERIHRSNLIGMGVLPLQFLPGAEFEALGLTGREIYDIEIPDELVPGQEITVRATAFDGSVKTFQVLSRLDTAVRSATIATAGSCMPSCGICSRHPSAESSRSAKRPAVDIRARGGAIHPGRPFCYPGWDAQTSESSKIVGRCGRAACTAFSFVK